MLLEKDLRVNGRKEDYESPWAESIEFCQESSILSEPGNGQNDNVGYDPFPFDPPQNP